MFDEDSSTPVPILGIRISPETGKVLPVGGTNNKNQPIIPYEYDTEAMSNQQIRVYNAYYDSDGKVNL